MFPATGEWIPTPYLEVPSGVVGLAVLSLFVIVFGVLTYGLGHHLTTIRLRRWILTIGLSLFAGFAGALGEPLLNEAAALTGYEGIVNYPMIIPFIGLLLAMLAAIWVNPAAALLVALSYSLTNSWWISHQIYDIFTPVFVAVLVAVLLQLRMEGRFYSWLRRPVVASTLGAMLQLFLLTLSTFVVIGASRSTIAAANSALLQASAEVMPILITAIVAGLIITLIRRWAPVSSQQKAIWLPYSDNLNGRIITTFVLITALLSFLMITVAYGLTRPAMLRATVNQMADDLLAAKDELDDFHEQRIELLEWATADIGGNRSVGDRIELTGSELDLLLDTFDSIVILDRDQNITGQYSVGESKQLTETEIEAAKESLVSGSAIVVPANTKDSVSSSVSFVVGSRPDQPNGNVIIGRSAQFEISDLLVELEFDLPGSYAFLRYGESDLAILPESVSDLPPSADFNVAPLTDAGATASGRMINENLTVNNQRYSGLSIDIFETRWSLGLVVPSDEILASGLNLMGQGVLIFSAGLVFAAVMILLIVDSASHVLRQITQQTQRAASMGIDTPLKNVGDGDEIGGLATAFRRLQMAFRQQWEEQRLLLEVSENIATTFDLHQGMPIILNAAVKGMGAAAARIVVARSADTKILSFAHPAEEEKNIELDRHLLTIMQDKADLICRSSEEVRIHLPANLISETMPQAMALISLKTDEQHQGLICVWRYDARLWRASQLRFLRTLASSASTLITNAKLLATVENGRRRLSAIISSTADAVLATNESNRIMLLNDAMEQYFDIKMKDVLGRKLETVLDNSELVRALSTNGSSPSRIEVTANDGHVLDGQVSSLSYNGGTSAGSVVVLRDVTRFKELDEMKSDFVANVSHDLRSPLTQMLTYSQLIPMDGPLTENQFKWLSRVERAVVDMRDLIEVLLDLNRLESGVALVTVPFRIEEIFQGIEEDYFEEAQANGLTITYEAGKYLPVVDGDVDLIKQAIRNIVSNAIKYAPNSGDLTLSAEGQGDYLVICVADNGPGIAESDVGRIFEKFYRPENQNNGEIAGRGLGLALVKSIAERHGGRAWCESQPGVGSRFYISLPVLKSGQQSN